MAKKTKTTSEEYTPSDKELTLINMIFRRFKSAYEAKDNLGLPELWKTCQDYWAGRVNLPENEDDPGSETNIIQPIIESQVADIVNADLDMLVKGVGPSDQEYAQVATQILKFIWNHNKMIRKLDSGERDRLNLGNIVWKNFWDKDALSGLGLPSYEPFSPDCYFPDPKITDVDDLQKADFQIQTMWLSLRQIRHMFKKKGKYAKPEGSNTQYDSRIFGEGDNLTNDDTVNDQAQVLEYWERKDDNKLRRVYLTKDVVLADSDDPDEDDYKLQDNQVDEYPFTLILGYKVKGQLWGMGDTEQLIPVQDLINDLDDQLRLNARATGNAQTVVGVGSGINVKKWTNKPGLKIPAKDHTAFTVVNPPYVPGYINQRREKGFYESELVSGRSDVVEGRRSGSLRAASAVLALQDAGSRRTNHKKIMLNEGLQPVIARSLTDAEELMTTEQAFDITENDKVKYLWFRASDLKNIPQLTYNENYNKESDDADNKGRYKKLYEDSTTDEMGNEVPGELMTKRADFDIEITLGTGLSNNKSFLYDAVVELHRENLVTTEESRQTLKKLLNWPVIDPWNPQGTFAGRNSSAEQLDIANSTTNGGANGATIPIVGQTPQTPQTTPQVSEVNPAILQQVQQLMLSGNPDPNQLYALLKQLPSDVLQAVLEGIKGGAQ